MVRSETDTKLGVQLSSANFLDWTDEELIEKYRADRDAAVFEALVRRYEVELYSFLRRFLGDSQRAEDAFQSTFVTVHLQLEKFEAGRRFRPWLYAVATNKAIDFKRQAKRRSFVSLDGDWEGRTGQDAASLTATVASREADPVALAIQNELRDDVHGMLAKLSESTQILLNMAFFQGMKYADISEALGIPVGTVKSRVFNAMRKLSEQWKRINPND